jgi:mitochondrial fission protein ELM1
VELASAGLSGDRGNRQGQVSLLRRGLLPERLTPNGTPDGPPIARKRPARIIWRFSDAKPGHDNQSLGLVEALGRRLAVEVHELPVATRCSAWLELAGGRFAAGAGLPDPWLLVGAGHATQLPLLAARRARRGRAVVLMSPQLPAAWFDLCIIPDHDRPRVAPNVLVTRGSVNRMQRARWGDMQHGLFLLGGPSRHFRWDPQAVLEQLARIVRRSPDRRWVVATSRRTPAGFAHLLEQRLEEQSRLRIVSWQDRSGDWLAGQLEQSACVWVSEDSVSMIYEALTAGVPTGLLALPARRRGRVVRGIENLQQSRQVTPYRDWCSGTPLYRPEQSFDAANQCAQWICDRWGQEGS